MRVSPSASLNETASARVTPDTEDLSKVTAPSCAPTGYASALVPHLTASPSPSAYALNWRTTRTRRGKAVVEALADEDGKEGED